MKISINAIDIVNKPGREPTGLPRVDRAILQALPLVGKSDHFHAFVRHDFDLELPKNVTKSISWQKILGNRRWGRELDARFDRSDVLYSLSEPLPKGGRAKKCAILHDLLWLTHPEICADPKDCYHWPGSESQYSLNNIRDQADFVHCNSRHTAQMAQEHLGISPDRLFVAHLGMIPMTAEPEAVNLPSLRFLLTVSRIDPQKNYCRLMEAFSLLEDKDLHLVVAGKEGWRCEEVYETVARLNLSDRVHFLKYVSDGKLIWLYQNAVAYVCSSLSEGFGLPILEAMHYGCPVAASNGGAVPEVIGDCGYQFDPLNVEEMSVAIGQAIDKPKIETAQERASLFTFERTAEEIMGQFRARL